MFGDASSSCEQVLDFHLAADFVLQQLAYAYFSFYLPYQYQLQRVLCGKSLITTNKSNILTCLFSKLSLVVPTKRQVAPHDGDETKFEISSIFSFEFTSFTKFMVNEQYLPLTYINLT
jgi:hypothetical protein